VISGAEIRKAFTVSNSIAFCTEDDTTETQDVAVIVSVEILDDNINASVMVNCCNWFQEAFPITASCAVPGNPDSALNPNIAGCFAGGTGTVS